jgi:ribosomal protein S4
MSGFEQLSLGTQKRIKNEIETTRKQYESMLQEWMIDLELEVTSVQKAAADEAGRACKKEIEKQTAEIREAEREDQDMKFFQLKKLVPVLNNIINENTKLQGELSSIENIVQIAKKRLQETKPDRVRA